MAQIHACSVNPSTIALGGQSNLIVTIDAPAPPGGITVLVDTDFNGDRFTLVNIPDSVGVEQGETTGEFLLETTQDVDNPATQITFSAHVGAEPSKAAQLNITLNARPNQTRSLGPEYAT